MTREKDYFKTFCDISRAFGTAATKSELLDLVVQKAIDTMGGKAACLFLAEEKQKEIFVAAAQKGLSQNYLHASPLKAKSLSTALTTAGFLAFEDATADPRLENHDAKQAEGIASILTVPVMVQNAVIGVLSLYTSDHRKFDEEDINFLRALAEQGGMAIEKASLLERIYKNVALFLELASAINSTLDIKKVLEYLTVKVCAALNMKGAVIRLLDQDSDTLTLVASHGLSQEFLEKGYIAGTESSRRALRGETVTVSDVLQDKELRLQKEILQKENLRAMIIAPIMAREKVIGTIRLYSETPRQFTPDMVTLLQAIGHQGGLAIQNASMFMQLQEDKKSLEDEIWSHRSWF